MSEDRVAKEFTLAVNGNHPDKVRMITSRHPDFDPNTEDPVHIAVTLYHYDLLDALLEAKADINRQSEHGGETPLALAVKHDSLTMAEKLLRCGANPNAPSRVGNTPPLLFGKSPEMVKLLLAYGADPNATNSKGKTPLLHFTASVPACKLLLKAGANIEQRDLQGYTPLVLAVEWMDADMVKFLLESGANTHVFSPHDHSPIADMANSTIRSLLAKYERLAQKQAARKSFYEDEGEGSGGALSSVFKFLGFGGHRTEHNDSHSGHEVPKKVGSRRPSAENMNYEETNHKQVGSRRPSAEVMGTVYHEETNHKKVGSRRPSAEVMGTVYHEETNHKKVGSRRPSAEVFGDMENSVSEFAEVHIPHFPPPRNAANDTEHRRRGSRTGGSFSSDSSGPYEHPLHAHDTSSAAQQLLAMEEELQQEEAELRRKQLRRKPT